MNLIELAGLDDAGFAERLSYELDDRTIAYALAVRAAFDSLRQAVAQLAGLLVLASSGARSSILDHPMLERATARRAEAEDLIERAKVPTTAIHHHHHLRCASAGIGRALALAANLSYRSDDAVLDRVLAELREAWRELHRTTQFLPGFQVVDFGQACCAAHVLRPPAALDGS